MFKNSGLAILSLLMLTACGEVSFKRGAGPDQYARDKLLCQKNNTQGDQVQKCMEDSGWSVAKLDKIDLDLVAVAHPEDNQRTVIKKDEVSSKSDAVKTNSEINQAKNKQSSSSTPNQEETIVNKNFKISSWWKMGGSDDQSKSAIKACSAELNETPIVDSNYKVYSRDFLICMKKAGWSGLRKS
jgi:hypothetical protein